jgi:hypothetical protein
VVHEGHGRHEVGQDDLLQQVRTLVRHHLNKNDLKPSETNLYNMSFPSLIEYTPLGSNKMTFQPILRYRATTTAV